jgi:group I intron endonuclease
MNKNIIYGLIDPRDGQLRYIGKSTIGTRRIKSHCYKNSLKPRTLNVNWIKSLLNKGLTPDYIIIEEHNNPENLIEAEIFNIAYFKSIGCNLNNMTLGGEGTLGRKFSESTRKRLSEVNKGNKHALGAQRSLEYCKMISKRNKGRQMSELTKAKLLESHLGKKQTPEHIKKRMDKINAQPRKPHSAEAKLKMSLAKLGKKHNYQHHSKTIIDHNGIIYKSIISASRALNINGNSISDHLGGRIKHIRGYTFAYFEDGFIPLKYKG